MSSKLVVTTWMDHGTYPLVHLKPKRTAPSQASAASRDRQANRPAARGRLPAPAPAADAEKDRVPAAPKLTPTRQLLQDITEAGGTLTRNVKTTRSLWYLVDNTRRTLWINSAGTGHPKATE